MHVRGRELIGGASEIFETTHLAHRTEQRKTSSVARIQRVLRDVGRRPTRQRTALIELLDRYKRRWVTAEALYSDVSKGQYPVSRATVTYTLRRLEQAHALKRITVPGSKKAWFVIERPITGRGCWVGKTGRLKTAA
jgi:hypothetical protein